MLVIEDITGRTGLEIETDPGVSLVYAGFTGLVTSFIVSSILLSHSQVWAVEEEEEEQEEEKAVQVGDAMNMASSDVACNTCQALASGATASPTACASCSTGMA